MSLTQIEGREHDMCFAMTFNHSYGGNIVVLGNGNSPGLLYALEMCSTSFNLDTLNVPPFIGVHPFKGYDRYQTYLYYNVAVCW